MNVSEMQNEQPQPIVQRWAMCAGIALAVIFLCYLGLLMYRQSVYPYGWSHSCDKNLLMQLWGYAADNDGRFPFGESSPEASLSLLARPPYNVDPEILRGKTVAKEVVETIFAQGELLGPETCGWHYVEGLRKDDDPRLALFWDKVGLGHNGERLSNGNRTISRISGANETILGSEWKAFLEEQRSLLNKLPEERKRLALRDFPP